MTTAFSNTEVDLSISEPAIPLATFVDRARQEVADAVATGNQSVIDQQAERAELIEKLEDVDGQLAEMEQQQRAIHSGEFGEHKLSELVDSGMTVAEFLGQVETLATRSDPTDAAGDLELPQATKRLKLRRYKGELVVRLRTGLNRQAEQAVVKLQERERKLQEQIAEHDRDVLKARGQRSRLEFQLVRFQDARDGEKINQIEVKVAEQQRIVDDGTAAITAYRKRKGELIAEIVWFYAEALISDDLFDVGPTTPGPAPPPAGEIVEAGSPVA